jgi:DNA-binding GntR family transcriptional regulator
MSQYPKPHLVLIKPQGLHQLVVEQIQQMIIEGALAPGTRLNERLLCEKLGVSRTPLREALKILRDDQPPGVDGRRIGLRENYRSGDQ